MKKSLSLNGELADIVLPFTHENIDKAVNAIITGSVSVITLRTSEDFHDPLSNKKEQTILG